MRFAVTVMEGVDAGRVMSLPTTGRFVVGRGIAADGRLNEASVSREHCALDIQGDSVVLHDSGSVNGTLVNGQRTTAHRLVPGDEITIGFVRLRFDAVQESSESTQPEIDTIVRPDSVTRPVQVRTDPVDKPPSPKTSFFASTAFSKTSKSIRLPTQGQPAASETPPPATLSQEFTPDLAQAFRMTLDPGQVLPEKTAQADSPELLRTRQYLNAICRFAAKLPGHVQADDVAALATEAIFDVIGAENAAMLLIDEQTGKPRLVCHRRKGGGRSAPFVVSQSVVEETLRQGESLFTNNAAADDRFVGQSIVAQAIRSLMCVPIQSHDRMIGTFYVDRRVDTTRFRQSDLAVMSALGYQAGVALERARLIDDLQTLFVGAMQTMVRSLEAKDAYTRGHSERVMRYALAIADRLGWDREKRDVLELGALMHDIGKIGVPDRILLKPAPLDAGERAVMSTHPVVAAEVLGAMPNLERLVPVPEIIAAVRHHHETFSGSGYPDGLKGDAIPETAQILGVVDTYDALTTTRPYREGRTREEAMEVLQTLHDTQVSGRMARIFTELMADGLDRRLDRIPLRFERKAAPLGGGQA